MVAVESQHRRLRLQDLIELILPPGQRSIATNRAIALHEAGHAVVAHELGLPVLEISIVGSGTVGGWVNTKLDDPVITRDGWNVSLEHI